jgi:hypothetical protein
MTKVKFNVNSEYMYIQNYKVLQSKLPPQKISLTRQTPSPATTSRRRSPSRAS